jgi:hypothetical protein
MKLKLKAPGIERFKLKYDNLLSFFAFNFNLRRYTLGTGEYFADDPATSVPYCRAGAYTRSR